jgi:hypothetical protein
MRRLDHVPPLSRGCLCFDRFEEFRSAEEDARRRATYESVKSARDALALELRELYPSFHERLADLFADGCKQHQINARKQVLTEGQSDAAGGGTRCPQARQLRSTWNDHAQYRAGGQTTTVRIFRD